MLLLFLGTEPADITGARRFSKQDAMPGKTCFVCPRHDAKTPTGTAFPQSNPSHPEIRPGWNNCIYLLALS
jgi:hypothetical protein